MDARHQRIGELYHEALDRPREAREAFLEEACPDDPILRKEVAELLAAHTAAGDFMAAPGLHDVAGMLANHESDFARVGVAGHYRVISVLGRGGMGEVYLAEDPRLGRKVALKILPPQFTANPDSLRRFEQEARAASSLNHPNIITIYDIGQFGPVRFLVMELVEGETLRQMLARSLPLDRIGRLGVQIAQALKVAHAAGIVHRDIKPENIMVRADGYVKVLDFGLARLLPAEVQPQSEETATGTRAGVIVGTPRYMSPEQARGQSGSSASDIFSLGTVLYELVAGRPPFGGEAAVTILNAILTDEPFPPSRINPAVPGPIDALVMSMLNKDEQRRPTAAEVEETFASIGRASPPAAVTPTALWPDVHNVGRENELARLREAVESASAGRAQLICVSGEPGIGKTTLVEMFLAETAAAGRRCHVARGRCSERLAGAEAYLPWLEAIDDLLRQSGGESIARTLKTLAPTWHSQLTAGDSGSARPGQEGSQERLKREFTQFVQEVCRVDPLVLFFDDLHWADASTIDLLAYLAMRFAGWRILIVVTYRPTDMALARHPFLQVKPELQRRGNCHELSLDLLTRADIDQYLSLEFPGHRFAPTLAALIHQKTEGNPLFMVDLVQYFRDRAVIAIQDGVAKLAQSLPWVEQDLPESIRGMIERKIGQLGDEDRQLLTAASVQGFEFDSAVLSMTVGVEAAAVEEHLEALSRVHAFVAVIGEHELPNGTPSLRCRFVHVLYQNAFYASLRPARKSQLSATVAQALLGCFGAQSGTIAAQLASLFEAARDFSSATAHYLIAAQNAAKLFAYQETIALAQRGIDLIRKLPDSAEHRQRELDCQLTLISALLIVKGYGSPEAMGACLRARELSSSLEGNPSLFTVLINLSIIHSMKGQGPAAREVMEQCLELARQEQDDGRIMMAHELLGETFWGQGMFARSRQHFEASATLYDRSRDFVLAVMHLGNDLGVACQTVCAHSVWYLGYPDRALEWSTGGVALAYELAHPWSLAFGLCHAALFRIYRREYEEALKIADAGLTVARENDFELWIGYLSLLRGRALAARGEHDEAIDLIRQGIILYRAGGNELECPLFAALLAEVCLLAGRIDEGLREVDDGLARAERNGIGVHKPELYRVQGELLLIGQSEQETSSTTEAEAAFERALQIARVQEAKLLELRAATSLARLWTRQRQFRKAHEILAPVYEWFTEGFETADLQDARDALSSLSF